MTVRTELPWQSIQTEIVSAIDCYNDQRPFINIGRLADYVSDNAEEYPVILDGVRNATQHRAVQGRISVALNKLGWDIFSHHASARGAKVYIDPRYR